MAARVIVTRLPRLLGAEAMVPDRRFILIVPERKDDEALLAHERVHVEQMARHRFFRLRYVFSREFRLEMEVEAYRVQLALRPGSLEAFAKALATRYWLGPHTDIDIARALLLAPPTDAKKDHAP